MDVFELQDEESPLTLGKAVHKAVQEGFEEAEKYYRQSQYGFKSFKLENNIFALERWANELQPKFKNTIKEMEVYNDWYIGYVDAYDPINQKIWDFKYTSLDKADKYKTSPQVMVYADLMSDTYKAKELSYLLIPKPKAIKIKKTEIPFQFRERYISEIYAQEPLEVSVEYDDNVVKEVYDVSKYIMNIEPDINNFNPVRGGLCDRFCPYHHVCAKNGLTVFDT